jgi:hypothetical protein
MRWIAAWFSLVACVTRAQNSLPPRCGRPGQSKFQTLPDEQEGLFVTSNSALMRRG